MTKRQPLPNVVGTPTPEDPVGKLKFGRSIPDNALPGTEGQKSKNKDKDKAEQNNTIRGDDDDDPGKLRGVEADSWNTTDAGTKHTHALCLANWCAQSHAN